MKMRLRPFDSLALGLTVVLILASTFGIGQEATTSHVMLRKLIPPVYPPLARQAMIRGDVIVKISLRADGIVESVIPISGHPMLVQAAINSAEQSKFECVGCTASGGTQSFIYSFEQSAEKPDPCCCSGNRPASASSDTQVLQSDNHIRVIAPPFCVCPDACTEKWAEEHSYFRSPKCLYLWKCGHRKIDILSTE